MKLSLTLLVSAFMLAFPNVMANPVPGDDIAIAVSEAVEAAELVPRAIGDSCTVSGKGGLNVWGLPFTK
jgi:hypothetical protein